MNNNRRAIIASVAIVVVTILLGSGLKDVALTHDELQANYVELGLGYGNYKIVNATACGDTKAATIQKLFQMRVGSAFPITAHITMNGRCEYPGQTALTFDRLHSGQPVLLFMGNDGRWYVRSAD